MVSMKWVPESLLSVAETYTIIGWCTILQFALRVFGELHTGQLVESFQGFAVGTHLVSEAHSGVTTNTTSRPPEMIYNIVF